jgi:hypothetical protein
MDTRSVRNVALPRQGSEPRDSVLDCGSPLPLVEAWVRPQDRRTGALQDATAVDVVLSLVLHSLLLESFQRAEDEDDDEDDPNRAVNSGGHCCVDALNRRK